MRQSKKMFALSLIALLLRCAGVGAQPAQSKSSEWEKIVEAAKKEGRVVAAIPTSAELRKELEGGFQAKFPGIGLEVSVSRGASNTNKIVEEQSAGVRGTDLHIGGTTSIVTALLARSLLDPVLPTMVLPDVREPKNWWGGHLWADNAKRFIYSFTAYVTETLWYNSNLVKPGEIASYDQLLDPKWKGKIVILDPRTPGSGESTWGFLWKVKGEQFLNKLAAQEMMVGRNQRQLAEALARGKSAISIGVSYYTLLPFIKAGLPVKPIPYLKEGFYAGTGSGNLAVLKNAAHPNATKVFVNWFLSKEGQVAFMKALGQPTRRLDVDTQGSKELGYTAAKEGLTPEKYFELENSSENAVLKIRVPAMRLADKLFQ
jgi:ABC-type Fe3+ transport system substrate-binding protein